jgi:hypothetical protein
MRDHTPTCRTVLIVGFVSAISTATAEPVKYPPDDALDFIGRARKAVRESVHSDPGKQLPFQGDSPHSRLGADIEAATVQKWQGVAKVTETTMPGTGERLYKISNGTATYCVRIPSPRVGIDRYEWERNNFHPIKCPR